MPEALAGDNPLLLTEADTVVERGVAVAVSDLPITPMPMGRGWGAVAGDGIGTISWAGCASPHPATGGFTGGPLASPPQRRPPAVPESADRPPAGGERVGISRLPDDPALIGE
ncbi:hypothetical protein AB0L74_29715 [Streptomyces sp. NPDC052020]|uniref:hypothetical protein n=1 Tax=Streptomyces sp. NPDC052020 TaxID=3155677 RepID=UPI00343E4C5D